MRRARLHYPDSLHHIMSRGYEGKHLFQDPVDKIYLLSLWRKFKERHGIIFYAWCIMDNHYHLILQNPEDQLSRFMRDVNSTFGIYFRMKTGGRGSVFDGRFRSNLIENHQYLRAAILYLYRNPLRAGLTSAVEQYSWSSLQELTGDSNSELTDRAYVNELFGGVSVLRELLDEADPDLDVRMDRWGESLGSQSHRFKGLAKSSRRLVMTSTAESQRRIKDRVGNNPGLLIEEFLQARNLTDNDLTGRSWQASRLRGLLLIQLRDKLGMKLIEIHRLKPFRRMSINSLGDLYSRTLKNMKGE